jgi:condensin complex subunit 3
VTPATLPAILDRTRDVDVKVRQLVFQQILYLPIKNAIENKLNLEDPSSVGLAHPRAMQIAQRELVVRNGLGDREPSVRAAASRVLSAWVDIATDPDPNGGPGSVLDNLLAFLGMFDLTSDNTAEEALLCILAIKTDVVDALSFDGTHGEYICLST